MFVNGRRGFALLEATAALFVATVGLFGVVQMFQTTADEIRTVQEKYLAERILRNEIEFLTALPFDELAPGSAMLFRTESPELDHLFKAQARVNISVYPDAVGSLREVTVRLDWVSTHGRPIRRSLTTLVARSTQ